MKGASMLILTVALAGCGHQPTFPHSRGPSRVGWKGAGPNRVIGRLKWEIAETKSGKVIVVGDREILLKDVKISEVPAMAGKGTLCKKEIEIGRGFRLGLSDYPVDLQRDLHGFGMTAEAPDKRSFSWEWFNVEGAGRARKLQETGELSFGLAKTALGLQITTTEFLSDVSLRIELIDVDKPVFTPVWRVRISKGSTISWPYLLNGKLTPG